ncbi:hypothetical protein L2E82_49969 [Cichorium intybus]|nr:hypothetical protein L2E82_49969 [Cichorium intybus]
MRTKSILGVLEKTLRISQTTDTKNSWEGIYMAKNGNFIIYIRVKEAYCTRLAGLSSCQFHIKFQILKNLSSKLKE